MNEQNIREYLLPYVFDAALRAGEAIMAVYNSSAGYGVSLKSDHTPITDADRAAHNVIKETLGPTRIPILSEEGREMAFEERRNWDLFWLVDPLDGTLEFINNNNEFTVNIALVYHNEVIAGVIYVPYHNRIYFANRGHGAYVCEGISTENGSYAHIMDNAVRLPKVISAHDVQRIALSRSHTTSETLAYVESLRALHPDLEVIEQGSSYKFCILAEGEVDYYVRTTQTYEWDTAAGEIILSEAGGSTRSLSDEMPLGYNKENPQNPNFHSRSAHSRL